MAREQAAPSVLRRAQLFSRLGDADLAALSLCLRVRRYAPGEHVFREGSPGATMLILAEGVFVATVLEGGGRERMLNRMGQGEVVGEMAFLDPGPRSASVMAETEAVAYELSHDAAEVLRTRAPRAFAAVLTGAIYDVTRRLRRLDERIEQELSGAR